jgi:hypothetical protein
MCHQSHLLCWWELENGHYTTSPQQGMTNFMEILCKRVRFKRHTHFQNVTFELGVLQCRYSAGDGGERRVLRPKASEGMQDHP